MATSDSEQPGSGPSSPEDSANGGAGSGSGSGSGSRERSALIYCGLCGALNPAGNHFCAACGTTLVDAFHASEGLRVFERPDAASRLIEIVPSGRELDVVDDADAPADYARVRLASGRLGYIRLQEVEELAASGVVRDGTDRTPDINTNARGCISSTGAIGSLALLLATAAFGLALLALSDSADTGILAAVFCVVILPILLLTTGFYLYARSHDSRETE